MYVCEELTMLSAACFRIRSVDFKSAHFIVNGLYRKIIQDELPCQSRDINRKSSSGRFIAKSENSTALRPFAVRGRSSERERERGREREGEREREREKNHKAKGDRASSNGEGTSHVPQQVRKEPFQPAFSSSDRGKPWNTERGGAKKKYVNGEKEWRAMETGTVQANPHTTGITVHTIAGHSSGRMCLCVIETEIKREREREEERDRQAFGAKIGYNKFRVPANSSLYSDLLLLLLCIVDCNDARKFNLYLRTSRLLARGHGGVVVTLLALRLGETRFYSRRSGSWNFACGNRARRCRWSARFLGDTPSRSPFSFQHCPILATLQPHRLSRSRSEGVKRADANVYGYKRASEKWIKGIGEYGLWATKHKRDCGSRRSSGDKEDEDVATVRETNVEDTPSYSDRSPSLRRGIAVPEQRDNMTHRLALSHVSAGWEGRRPERKQPRTTATFSKFVNWCPGVQEFSDCTTCIHITHVIAKACRFASKQRLKQDPTPNAITVDSRRLKTNRTHELVFANASALEVTQ
ncbi:hypothetical protein PR048_006191 [Dryococelus australis]|uniref:Uncharacterized protein n=1 Tax=Dryococelus australis TaxID=614101 RepID=A0ABQ9IAB0_9NEOP|nr:hypothetical protein PR048_006191 [Dryococelus australis]